MKRLNAKLEALDRDIRQKVRNDVSNLKKDILNLREDLLHVRDRCKHLEEQNRALKARSASITSETSRRNSPPTDRREELRQRTIVVRGFEQDTKRDEIKAVLTDMFEGVEGVEDLYCPFLRHSIGFARFLTIDAKKAYLDSKRQGPAFKKHDREFRTAPDLSAKQRRRNFKVFSLFKSLEDKLGDSDEIERENARGIIWVNGKRVARLSPYRSDTEQEMVFDHELFATLGFEIDSQALMNEHRAKFQQ